MRYKKNSIGGEIRRLRKERAWSLDDVSVQLAQNGCFLSERTLTRIEWRCVPVGMDEMQAFAKIFRTSVEYFLNFSPSK